MKYELEYLPSAQRDMLDIVTYIGKVLCNPIAADRLAHKFIDEVEKVRDFPYSMPMYYPIRELEHDYRKLLVDNYIMLYWVEEVRHCVTVARVIYAKSDYSKSLK